MFSCIATGKKTDNRPPGFGQQALVACLLGDHRDVNGKCRCVQGQSFDFHWVVPAQQREPLTMADNGRRRAFLALAGAEVPRRQWTSLQHLHVPDERASAPRIHTKKSNSQKSNEHIIQDESPTSRVFLDHLQVSHHHDAQYVLSPLQPSSCLRWRR